MAIQGSGQVSLNDLHVEAGGTSGTECSFNDSDIRGLISKGAAAQMGMDEWYGASNVFTFNMIVILTCLMHMYMYMYFIFQTRISKWHI